MSLNKKKLNCALTNLRAGLRNLGLSSSATGFTTKKTKPCIARVKCSSTWHVARIFGLPYYTDLRS